ncbi:MAG: protein translocase subunit SecD, partial [Algiphilus sp.]
MKPFALWKYAVLAIAVVVGILYALPNLFGDDPAVQISHSDGDPISARTQERVVEWLEDAGINVQAARATDGQQIV